MPLAPTGTLTGRFVDKFGDPVAGVRVECGPRQPPVSSLGIWKATTDQQGSFAISGLIAGTEYTVHARPPEYSGPALFVAREIRVSAGQTLELGEYSRTDRNQYRKVKVLVEATEAR